MFYLFVVITLIIDQASKAFVKSGFWVNGKIPLLWDYFYLESVHNSGVAFSFPIQWLVLQILTILLIIGIVYYFLRHEEYKENTFVKIAYGSIIGSAISHAYERIFIGHVVDFIWVKYFAIFNFADIFITISVVFLIIIHLGIWKQKK